MSSFHSLPREVEKSAINTIVLGGGCFWGVEEELSAFPGVLATEVGYCGGTTSEPNYEQVCTGSTGHTESVRVTFDPEQTNVRRIVTQFLGRHGFTHSACQIKGGQYKAVVFHSTQLQLKEASEAIAEFNMSACKKSSLLLQPAGEFWKAEERHQKYYVKHERGSRR